MTRSTTPDSPRSATLSLTHPITLSISNVANIFVKMRRVRRQAQDTVKSHHIMSTSGDPQTHPALCGEGVTAERKVPISHSDVYVCIGAVDVPKLLRVTRASLMDTAEQLGANVLVDEQWKTTICGPKHRSNGTFKVHVEYSAAATRSQIPDPKRPVALDKVKCVPGLMTILKREE